MPSSGVQTCARSEEHTSELQSHSHLVCRLLLEKKNIHPQNHPLQQETNRVRPQGAEKRPPPPPAPPCIKTQHQAGQRCPQLVGHFFFLIERATTDISPLPLRAPLPS